jgi:hypothetical protein
MFRSPDAILAAKAAEAADADQKMATEWRTTYGRWHHLIRTKADAATESLVTGGKPDAYVWIRLPRVIQDGKVDYTVTERSFSHTCPSRSWDTLLEIPALAKELDLAGYFLIGTKALRPHWYHHLYNELYWSDTSDDPDRMYALFLKTTKQVLSIDVFSIDDVKQAVSWISDSSHPDTGKTTWVTDHQRAIDKRAAAERLSAQAAQVAERERLEFERLERERKVKEGCGICVVM